MPIKILVISFCTVASIIAMEYSPRTQFMQNGAALSATMNSDERLQYMIDGHQHVQQFYNPQLSNPIVPVETVEPEIIPTPQEPKVRERKHKHRRRKDKRSELQRSGDTPTPKVEQKEEQNKTETREDNS